MRLLLTDAGVVTDAYLADAFGVEQLATGSTENPYRFGGAYAYYRDAATRLYVRHRHLGTSWGTSLSRDPLDWAGAESYVYGHNNPLEFVDPLGLKATRARLCIDDGPRNWAETLQIVDQLRQGLYDRTNIKAYFFVVGQQVELSAPLAFHMVLEGHLLGNHTYSHPRPFESAPGYPSKFRSFGHLSEDNMRDEFCQCHMAVLEHTDVRMIKYRAPGESRYPYSPNHPLQGQPYNWLRIDRAAKRVSPRYEKLMDESRQRIRTLNDTGFENQATPGQVRRILDDMQKWLADAPSDVWICYHNPQASSDFTTQLLRRLDWLGVRVEDAIP